MGSYEDTSWADLRGLTREHRRERVLALSMAPNVDEGALQRACLRLHGPSYEFSKAIGFVGVGRACGALSMQVFKANAWAHGVRSCFYCRVAMTREPNRDTSATCEHRHPRVLGGEDHPRNWAITCALCNGLKAAMPEADFLARPIAAHRGLIAHQLHGTRPGD